MNNFHQTLQEFDKRYKYCFEELEKYYTECFTSDCKESEWYSKYWAEKAAEIEKIINDLKLCAHDAKYLSELYKNNK